MTEDRSTAAAIDETYCYEPPNCECNHGAERHGPEAGCVECRCAATLIRRSTGRYASQVNAPLSPATVAALNERLAAGDYPVRKVQAPRHYDYPTGDPLPTIDGHAYVGTPTFGQRCQDGPTGATCGGLFEQHTNREPCYHLDSKRLGARPGDLSLWCACGAQVFAGPPASSDAANNPREQA